MSLPADVESIDGAQELYACFGYRPDFHDAEVVRFHLDLGRPSTSVIHTRKMTNQVNTSSFYELIKHVMVEFALMDVTSLNLQYPWQHSILLHLGISKTEVGLRMDVGSAYGLCGTIEAKKISLRITPGEPTSKAPSSS